MPEDEDFIIEMKGWRGQYQGRAISRSNLRRYPRFVLDVFILMGMTVTVGKIVASAKGFPSDVPRGHLYIGMFEVGSMAEGS